MTPLDISEYRPYIEPALEYANGSHTFDDVCALVASGKLQFWPGTRSAIVTEIVETPRKRTLNFFLAGGNLPELEQMTPVVLAWGKSQGCDAAAFFGRPGWERTFLARQGWAKVDMVVLETAL